MWSSFLSLLQAIITGMHHHAQLKGATEQLQQQEKRNSKDHKDFTDDYPWQIKMKNKQKAGF